MKKFITLMLTFFLFIVCLFSLSACNNNGFKAVQSITFTTNGEQKQFVSSFGPQFKMENEEYITAEEFNNAPKNKKSHSRDYDLNSQYSVKDAIKISKNATHYEVYEEELEGTWYITYSYSWDDYIYYRKATYKYTYFNIVYVKVKNDTTLVIKTGSIETTYTVSSYSIVDFK